MWKKKVEMHDVEEGEEKHKPAIFSGYVKLIFTIELLTETLGRSFGKFCGALRI